MHPSAYKNAEEFHNAYMPVMAGINQNYKVVEIGSQDVNGSLRTIWNPSTDYTGIDFVPGKGVDLILQDPYSIPLESECADVVLSSSVFEHSDMFWLLFLEIMRLLKPHGLFYLNVPSNGDFHRWPVDCWRFYPDSGRALETWAKRSGMNAALLESYTSSQSKVDTWNDFVAVFVKDEKFAQNFPMRILDKKRNFTNGIKRGAEGFVNFTQTPEDIRRLNAIGSIVNRSITVG